MPSVTLRFSTRWLGVTIRTCPVCAVPGCESELSISTAMTGSASTLLRRFSVRFTSAAEEIERRCGSSAHQGLCAQAGPYRYVSAEELLSVESPLLVALDQVQDPQNLGSICRTAECVGVAGVVIPER